MTAETREDLIAQARFIAADWHGGQWSAMYALASTGTVQIDRLMWEIDQTLCKCDPDHHPEDLYTLHGILLRLI